MKLLKKTNGLAKASFSTPCPFACCCPVPRRCNWPPIRLAAAWNIGGLIAGLLFVLPGALVMLLLAMIYALVGQVPLVDGLFLGIKAAVIVIVIEALVRVSRKALKRVDYWVIAALAFIGIFFPRPALPLDCSGSGDLRLSAQRYQ